MALQRSSRPTSPSSSGRQVATTSPRREPFPASRSTTLMSVQTANLSMEADQVLYTEPAAVRTVAWMGQGRAESQLVDTGAYHADPAKREEARRERARQARLMRAFVEDVETTMEDAGVPLPRAAPGLSPRSSTARGTGAFAPAFLRLSTPTTSHQPSPMARSSRSSTARGSGGKSQEQQEQLSRAVSTLAKSVDLDAVTQGNMFVSAFDGSVHATPETLLAHNAFVHCRMVDIVDMEERMEADGHIFSAAQSMIVSESGSAAIGTGPKKVRGRRPESIPKVEDWDSLPPTTDANGNPLDSDIVEAANRAYNDAARNSAKRLMAHRCFRRHDFVEEHQDAVAATTASAIDQCIIDGRQAGAAAFNNANADESSANEDSATTNLVADVKARAAEVEELCERWTKEAGVRGAPAGDAQRYDPLSSPTTSNATPAGTPSAAAKRQAHVAQLSPRRACEAFVSSAALLMAEPTVANGPVDRWVRHGRIAALRDAAHRALEAVGAQVA